MTISGISRAQRRKRAVQALKDVGLGDQLHKKPNQMSGGQMQRVAIARALVNNPDILLADEPSGALDSETSVQIMELLKQVAKDRLVVMVTHNPELAEAYASRIVRVKDGKLVDDTNPYSAEAPAESPKHKNMGRASMSFLTALSLSFNNLKTKKGRTILTAFAGSIGIIGIALILSLSNGFQMYIDQIQADTLSNYPLTIQRETADMTAAMVAMGSSLNAAEETDPGTVLEQQTITQMFAQIGSNDLGTFKDYLESRYSQIAPHITTVKYSYSVQPLIYLDRPEEKILQVNPSTLFQGMMGGTMGMAMSTNVFAEMVEDQQMLNTQYDVLMGKWPESKEELVFVLSANNQISDFATYTLGLREQESLQKMLQQIMQGNPVAAETPLTLSYDDLMALRFRLVPAHQLYRFNEEYQVWEDMTDDPTYMQELISQSMELKIVGIVCPKEGSSATALTPGIGYLPSLTHYVIQTASDAQIVADQLADPQINVFTGKGFDEKETDELNFQDMISVDSDILSSAFGMDINTNAIFSMLQRHLQKTLDAIQADAAPAQADFSATLKAMSTEMLQQHVAQNTDPVTGLAPVALADMEQIVDNYLAQESALSQMAALEGKYDLSVEDYQKVLRPLLMGLITDYISQQTVQPTEETAPDATQPEPTLPDVPEIPDSTVDIDQFTAFLSAEQIPAIVDSYLGSPLVTSAVSVMGQQMIQESAQQKVMQRLASFGQVLENYIGNSFWVDAEKISQAFQFNMTEDDLRRLMQAMSKGDSTSSAETNLRSLGYAELAQPESISIYMKDFAGKEAVLDFIDTYNDIMEESGQEEHVIRYTDITGMMMSSVRTIIDSVSYVLIAFVAVSLVVSSIMIGIITYISVMERTKEIGILRAIGASKRNISQVFNAETFIIGLCSGFMGVGVTLALNFPINEIIHSLTNNDQINAKLPMQGAIILIILSVVLTLIGGLIPSRKAAKKDPVIALRSE